MQTLSHSVLFRLGVSDRLLGLTVKTHLQMDRDTELALRFHTGIHNAAEFFTDLNGFQVERSIDFEEEKTNGVSR